MEHPSVRTRRAKQASSKHQNILNLQASAGSSVPATACIVRHSSQSSCAQACRGPPRAHLLYVGPPMAEREKDEAREK